MPIPGLENRETRSDRIAALPKIDMNMIADYKEDHDDYEVELDSAELFYKSKMNGVNIHPDAILDFAKVYRNILIENKKWNKKYQNFYDVLKTRYAENVSDMTEFEKDELQYNPC